ncbi:MAG: hypothetical protein ACLU5I_04750 [Alistipes finegoldii]
MVEKPFFVCAAKVGIRKSFQADMERFHTNIQDDMKKPPKTDRNRRLTPE